MIRFNQKSPFFPDPIACLVDITLAYVRRHLVLQGFTFPYPVRYQLSRYLTKSEASSPS